MCVKTDIQDHGSRLTALEGQHHTPEDPPALQADIARINAYLFGAGSAPDVPRSKSNVVKS